MNVATASTCPQTPLSSNPLDICTCKALCRCNAGLPTREEALAALPRLIASIDRNSYGRRDRKRVEARVAYFGSILEHEELRLRMEALERSLQAYSA